MTTHFWTCSTGEYLSRTLTRLHLLGFLLRCASKEVKEEHYITKITFTLRLSISGKMNSHYTKYPQTKTVVLFSPSHSAAPLPYVESFLSYYTFCLHIIISIIVVISTVNGDVSVHCLCSLIVIT